MYVWMMELVEDCHLIVQLHLVLMVLIASLAYFPILARIYLRLVQ